MTIELTYGLYSVVLTFVLIMIHASIAIVENGTMAQAGSRDTLPEPSVLNKRANRLRLNMLENMVLFIPLILIANAMGISNEMTILGAQIFVGARVVHAIIYLAGWPLIRPVLWFISVIGMGMIAAQLI